MGRGSWQGGAIKGKASGMGSSSVEARSTDEEPRFTSAADRKAARRKAQQRGRPGHVRNLNRQPDRSRGITRPGRRKN